MECWSWPVWENSGVADRKTSRERADLGEEADVLGLKKMWQDGIIFRPEHELDPRIPHVSEFWGESLVSTEALWGGRAPGVSHGVSGNQAPSCTFCPRRSCYSGYNELRQHEQFYFLGNIFCSFALCFKSASDVGFRESSVIRSGHFIWNGLKPLLLKEVGCSPRASVIRVTTSEMSTSCSQWDACSFPKSAHFPFLKWMISCQLWVDSPLGQPVEESSYSWCATAE